MNELDRIKKLAGIITESVMAVPGLSEDESDMQTAATAVDNSADAVANAASPQLTESLSEYEMTILNPTFNPEDDNSLEEIDVTVYYSISGKYVPARINYTDNDHPAEYPDLSIESVIDENGNDISRLIDDKTAKYIEEQLWDHVNSQEPDFDEPDDYGYDDSYDINETAPPGMEDMVLKLKKQYPGEEEKAFATAWSIYNKKHGKTEEAADMGQEENDQQTISAMDRFSELINSWVDYDEALTIVIRELDEAGVDADKIDEIVDAITVEYSELGSDNMNTDDMDGDFDSAMKSAGYGTDEDYNDFGGSDDMYEEVTEDFNLNNGYDDVKYADGNDYFPDGADSPVTTKTGPSGARQGDNPEQKKMEVTETHKELVYNYRKFLKESATK